MRAARILIVTIATVALLAIPAAASAQDAGLPEQMEDPIEAMEPEVDVAEPVQPADDVAAQGNAIPEADGIAAGVVDDGVAQADAAVAPATPVASGTGQLPFTGPDSGRLLQLFLVGSVLLSGGVVAMAWAGARSETA